MVDSREETDVILNEFQWPKPDIMEDYINTKDKFIIYLVDYRERVNTYRNKKVIQIWIVL